MERPCIGCGYCCQKAQCSLSLRISGQHELCPWLYHNMKRFMCGLAELFPEQIGINTGCCSALNTMRSNKLREDMG